MNPVVASREDDPNAAFSVTGAPGSSVTCTPPRSLRTHEQSAPDEPNDMLPPGTRRHSSSRRVRIMPEGTQPLRQPLYQTQRMHEGEPPQPPNGTV